MEETLIEFYVNKYNFITNLNELDLNFVPPILCRRLSILDKITLSNLNIVYSSNIQNIVFSSQYGEVERLNKIINQYQEYNEVSPNAFSGSVHNYSESFFLLNKQKSIPYTALSACEVSLSTGFLTSVLSNYNNILFCYSDFYNDKAISFALNFTKHKINKSEKYTIKLEKNNIVNDEFDNYVKFFRKNINFIKTSNYTVERG